MTKKFLVLTHVSHYRHNGKLKAYAPYVREMNLWFKNVDKSTVVAPFSDNGSFAKEETYTSFLNFRSIPSFDLLSSVNAAKAIFKIPVIALKVIREMKHADHLHLRCPGNIGLIASFCQVFFPKKAKTAKYAGNWDPKAEQPWTYRLQKWILSNTFLTRNMKVLVYGDWAGQTRNIKPFFTASFSESLIQEISDKKFNPPFTFLFVGNLVSGKQPIEALRLIKGLNEYGSPGTLEIYGDGPEREKLEDFCKANELMDMVNFKGNRALEELIEAYQKAHFVILPSRSEGWPKAIAEGMFFGCIPIATPVSCVPWMLDQGNRGILLTSNFNSQKLKAKGSLERIVGNGQWIKDVDKISGLMNNQKEMQRMSEEAKHWSQQYTLEKFEAAIKEVLQKGSSPLGRDGGVG